MAAKLRDGAEVQRPSLVAEMTSGGVAMADAQQPVREQRFRGSILARPVKGGGCTATRTVAAARPGCWEARQLQVGRELPLIELRVTAAGGGRMVVQRLTR
ncbi:hypothetical protein SESBI_07483 [Sesbania bispinosa]|nr:hypothetical protein SESBI_07483 [Sesbania bispinosa]